MKQQFGMIFGVTLGGTGGILLGVLVHPAFFLLIPVGICGGFLFDYAQSNNPKF